MEKMTRMQEHTHTHTLRKTQVQTEEPQRHPVQSCKKCNRVCLFKIHAQS